MLLQADTRRHIAAYALAFSPLAPLLLI